MERRKLMIGVGAVVLAGVLAGGGIAIASGGDDDGPAPTGPEADRAAAAALKATGGGEVLEIEADDEGRGAWEVEVRTTDGSVVEVVLDDAFEVVSSGGDDDGGSDDDDGAGDDDGSGVDDD